METILCPTDYSAASLNSLRYADEIAQRLNSRMILFHGIHEPVLADDSYETSYPHALEVYGEEAEGHLIKLKGIQAYLESTEWGIPISFETRIAYGKAQDSIAQVANSEKANLIVLGYEAEEGLRDIFLDSMAASIIRNTTCPVLHIPARARFKPLHKIVIATDLKGLSRFDFGITLRLASFFGAELQLLHAISQENEEARAFSFEELQRAGKGLGYPNFSTHVVCHPFVDEGISQFYRTQKADLLVVGYNQRNPWQHLFQAEQNESPRATSLPLLVLHQKRQV